MDNWLVEALVVAMIGHFLGWWGGPSTRGIEDELRRIRRLLEQR